MNRGSGSEEDQLAGPRLRGGLRFSGKKISGSWELERQGGVYRHEPLVVVRAFSDTEDPKNVLPDPLITEVGPTTLRDALINWNPPLFTFLFPEVMR